MIFMIDNEYRKYKSLITSMLNIVSINNNIEMIMFTLHSYILHI